MGQRELSQVRMISQSVRQVSRSWEELTIGLRLGDRLSQRLAELIESGEFGADGRLPPESELAGRFGVSRPVIREALARLRSMGLIVSRRGSGSYIQSRLERRPEAPVAVG